MTRNASGQVQETWPRASVKKPEHAAVGGISLPKLHAVSQKMCCSLAIKVNNFLF